MRDGLVEAMAEALTAKLKEHPVPAPSYGGTAEPAMFWGVTPTEVSAALVDAAIEYLSEHADEWVEESPLLDWEGWAKDAIARNLLAVLREGS